MATHSSKQICSKQLTISASRLRRFVTISDRERSANLRSFVTISGAEVIPGANFTV
jgi:hypothetical protein